nr:hypothetical protein BVC80_1833g150 [Tanacetum cinerariifolium]
MYGHYDYGSHHKVGGSSSQPNFGGSSSQPNVRSSSSQPNFRGSSSQPNVRSSSSQPNFRGSSSPVRQFSLEDEDFTYLRSRHEDAKRPRIRGHRRKKPWINVVFHRPLRKRLHCVRDCISSTLNTTVRSEDENEVEEVKEVRRPRPMGRDQAKRKMKAGSTSSTSSFDVAELAKMMDIEYVMVGDPYNIQKKQEMSELLKIKNQELELKVTELEIRRMENRQRDEALYETKTDEALKERLRHRLFG